MFYGSLTGFGGGGAAPFVALGAQFDGSNDFMRYTSPPLTGSSQTSKLVTACWWLKKNTGTDGQRMDFYNGYVGAQGGYPTVQSQTNNFLNIAHVRVDLSTPETQAWQTDDDKIMVADGWQWMAYSCDAGGTRSIYMDDTAQADNSTADLDENLDYNPTTDNSIGVRGGGSTAAKMDGDLAEFWVLNGVAVDLSVTANRRKFYSATGKPVDLGTDGQATGFGNPTIYLSLRPGDAASAFATNRGQGENFTITGTLTLSATNPGD
jgi:hypothetical protein